MMGTSDKLLEKQQQQLDLIDEMVMEEEEGMFACV
jgi:hypothetical protein